METRPFANGNPQPGMRAPQVFSVGRDYASGPGSNGVIGVTECGEAEHDVIANTELP